MLLRDRRMLVILAFLALLNIPLIAAAAPFDSNFKLITCDGPDCDLCDLAQLGQNILNAAIYLAVFMSAVLFAYAGFEALTSGGNAAKYNKARSVFTNVAIGLIIILVAWLVVDVTMKTFVPQSGTWGPWNKVCELFLSAFEHHWA